MGQVGSVLEACFKFICTDWCCCINGAVPEENGEEPSTSVGLLIRQDGGGRARSSSVIQEEDEEPYMVDLDEVMKELQNANLVGGGGWPPKSQCSTRSPSTSSGRHAIPPLPTQQPSSVEISRIPMIRGHVVTYSKGLSKLHGANEEGVEETVQILSPTDTSCNLLSFKMENEHVNPIRKGGRTTSDQEEESK